MFNALSRFFSAPAKSTAPVMDEIATLGNGKDWTRAFISPDQMLYPQDDILQTRTYQGKGSYDLFRDLLTDWTVFSALQQRRQALIAAELEIIPGGTKRVDKNAAAFLEDTLHHIGWDRVCNGMHYGIYYGFGVGECLWARDGSTVILDQVKIRDRRRFAFDGDQRLRMLTWDNGYPGELLPERKFWTFKSGADHDDDPYGMGLAHWLYWPVFFKRSGIKFWMIAAEKFGTPTAVGWFPPGTQPGDQTKLLNALTAIQTDAAIIMPEGMRAELLEAKRATGGDHDQLCQYMDHAITKVIMSQMAPAEQAANRVLNVSAAEPPTWQRLIKADADLICESFNRTVVRWLTEWNFPGAVPPQVFRRVEPEGDIAQRSEIERRVFDMGYRPTLKQIQDEYDGEWEPVPAAAAAPLPPVGSPVPNADAPAPDASAPAPNFSEVVAADSDPTAPLVERLGKEADPLLHALLSPVRAALNSSGDLMEFRAHLLTLYPDLDSKAFAELMGQALAVADVQGQWEANAGKNPAKNVAAYQQHSPPVHLTVNVAAPGPTRKTIQRTADGCYEVQETPEIP